MRAVHRHVAGHEHEFEPQYGLPEALPAGEHILWQGSPDWRALAVRAFHLRKLTLYFALLAALRAAFVLGDGGGAAAAALAGGWVAALAAVALGGLALMAWFSARGAVYTITDRRVVMRIGFALTVTFNLPYRHIRGADLHLDPQGSGDVALALSGRDRIAWLHLWPHVRPWRVRRPEPMLRCVPDARQVAGLLVDAWSRDTGLAASPTPTSTPTPTRPEAPATPTDPRQPLLAGR